jgi:hypothetical protein
MFYAVMIYGGPLRHKRIELAGGSDVVPRFLSFWMDDCTSQLFPSLSGYAAS